VEAREKRAASQGLARSGTGDLDRTDRASDGCSGGQAAPSRPRTDLRLQSPSPVLIQLDLCELEDQAQPGQAPGPHTATKTRIFRMCTGLCGSWTKGTPENQDTVKKKTGAHTFHRIKLPRRRNVPLALTSPRAKQSMCPGQRTQMNSTGKMRLCEIPCSLDLLHVPSSIYMPWGCQGQRGFSLALTRRAGGLSRGSMGFGLSPRVGCHHLRRRGLKGFLLTAQLWGLLLPPHWR